LPNTQSHEFSIEVIKAEDDPVLAALLSSKAFESQTTPRSLSPLEKRTAINDCGASTFINQGSAASPYVSDCYGIGANIAGGGTFEVGCGEGFLLKAKYGTCAWGAACDPQGLDEAYIGNSDIYDTINTSIDKFGSTGKVGSLGYMNCQGLHGTLSATRVRWGVYHT